MFSAETGSIEDVSSGDFFKPSSGDDSDCDVRNEVQYTVIK